MLSLSIELLMEKPELLQRNRFGVKLLDEGKESVGFLGHQRADERQARPACVPRGARVRASNDPHRHEQPRNTNGNGEPNVRELEPDRCVAEAVGRAPRRSVKLTLRRFRFRQAQEYENGAVERLHFFGGQ
jgi:hypothetical protein